MILTNVHCTLYTFISAFEELSSFSIMDHSCQPSATVSFTGNRLTVTCVRPAGNLASWLTSALRARVKVIQLLF